MTNGIFCSEDNSRKVFDGFCNFFSNNDWMYWSSKNEKYYSLELWIEGKQYEFPIEIKIVREQQSIFLVSKLPVIVSKDKKMVTALGVTLVNYLITNGNFDLDIFTGNLMFRMTHSFRGMKYSDESFYENFMLSAGITIEQFIAELFGLVNGEYTINDFFNIIKNKF